MKKSKKNLLRKMPKRLVVPTQLIEVALKKKTKAELVQFLVGFAKNHLNVRRSLEDELEIEKPVAFLVHDIESAITMATDFDDRDLNHNFDYDYGSYEAIEKGLKELIKQGQIEEAKRLSLELMSKGSYQVECSDEGMMTENIEACFIPVIAAVKKAGGESAKQWAILMLRADRVGFISERPLKQLQGAN